MCGGVQNVTQRSTGGILSAVRRLGGRHVPGKGSGCSQGRGRNQHKGELDPAGGPTDTVPRGRGKSPSAGLPGGKEEGVSLLLG